MTSLHEPSPGQILLSREDIAAGVAHVARSLDAHCTAAVVITVVPGGMLFAADLVRQLRMDLALDWISCPHTPGCRTNDADIHYRQTVPIHGRDVIVVDDAIESGATMARILAHLQTHGPRSLAVATLLVKPGRIALPVPQFHGFALDSDAPIVGYGLPWQDRWRQLPFVARLDRAPDQTAPTGQP
ncbi:phosphoribosyltransferase [Pseudaquabacterium rugosum]|uniref:Phosphoribosyltransferase family protein n=1 Tax=Pseudaquabacterium rugosum TaxID=2984194 RepID=A0ABU9B5C9_9BURK